MPRKTIVLLAAGVVLLILALPAWLMLRLITIDDMGSQTQIRAAAWTVGQALEAARLTLSPADRITPPLESRVPADGKITVERAVQLSVWENGALLNIPGTERTPAGLLKAAGIALGPQDRLLWNGLPVEPEHPLPVGVPVVLQLDHPAQITIETQTGVQALKTHAPTTAHALWEAGVRPAPGDRLSHTGNEALGHGASIAFLPARPLEISVQDRVITARSTAETVGQALAEAGIALQGLDYAQPAEDSPLPEDGKIRVVRVREEIVLSEEYLPFGSSAGPDPEVELDQTRVTQAGQVGIKVVRERVRYEDNQETSRVMDSDWTAREPVDQVVGYGTMVVVKTLDVPGGPIEYWREVKVYATSYSPCRLGTGDGRCNYQTSSGQTLQKGVIAVTLAWYRQMRGQQVYVPGYGFGVIADVGGGIPGTPWIDLGWGEDDYTPMLGWMTMYFLTPVPASVPWALP